MAIGDILRGIGTGAEKGLKATGEVLKTVLPQVGYALTGQGGELSRENWARQTQLEDQRKAVLGAQIEDALKVETDPAKRTALYRQLEQLVAVPKAGPGLVQKLHSIVHPQGTTAGAMQESLGAENPAQLAEMLGQTPPPAPKGKVTAGTFDIPGDSLPQGTHDVFGNPTDPKKVYRRMSDGGLVPTQPRTSGVPRVLPPISATAAQKMATQGISFSDENGEPIDVTQLDNTMQIVPIKMGAHTTYVVTSQGQTHLNVGNMVYAVPKLEQTDLGKQGVPLGPARVGSTSTREGVGVDPTTGKPVKQHFTSTTTPATTGVAGSGRKPVVPAVTPQTTSTAPTAAPTAQNRPVVPPVAKSPAGGEPAFMTPQMYNQQLQVARPVRVAANQIFGDPSQPDFKSLADYGDVMNNPDSVARIGKAARMMINDMASVEATKSGGMWTLITTAGGLPQALAQVQSEQARQAVANLQPREKELLNAEMDAYGAIIGLRAITKGSAAKFSAQSLEREVPIPGLSAFDAFSFYDKLSRLAEEAWSGSKGIDDGILPEKAYYQKKYQDLLAKKEQYRPKRKVGDPVVIKGVTKKITKIHPDGSFDAE